MRPLRYSINVSLDGCVDHAAFGGTEAVQAVLHRHATDNLARSDGLLLGRVTYELMEAGFRADAESGTSTDPFVAGLHAARKHVVSRTLQHVDWNAELVRPDLAEGVARLKEQPGRGLLVGGVEVPLVLARAGLVDEYELVVHPVVVGHGPTLLAGLPAALDLRRVSSEDLGEGVVAHRYEPRR
ncbi:dihydrofolate reductase family protein [Nocardioides aurantiacus]|uniref:Dihydrofolate reductase n=1 Tax=Nocardioides aurantiacus TaxID=86796 RepID=A0A3N2CPV7_9ACTN|nr:dihydrofolate reductase family protein [Nocardioides aurantiacus]ROR89550.1 dihydrofolate reductase [Nocardioides aurantiacus]